MKLKLKLIDCLNAADYTLADGYEVDSFNYIGLEGQGSTPNTFVLETVNEDRFEFEPGQEVELSPVGDAVVDMRNSGTEEPCRVYLSFYVKRPLTPDDVKPNTYPLI